MASTSAPLPMDHRYIEEHRIADRYLKRELSAIERARFEEHFVDCAECLDRVALAEIFRESLERSVEDHAAPSASADAEKTLPPEGPVLEFAPVTGSIQRRYQPWQYAALFSVAAILIAGLPTLFLLLQIRQFRTQLAKARTDAAAYAGNYSIEHKRVETLRRERSAMEVQLEGQAVPVFNLRENSPTRVAIPEESSSILLLPPLAANTSPKLYRAVVRNASGQAISEQYYLERGGSFGVVVRSNLLPQGEYILSLEEVSGQKSSSRYPFQAVHTGIPR